MDTIDATGEFITRSAIGQEDIVDWGKFQNWQQQTEQAIRSRLRAGRDFLRTLDPKSRDYDEEF